MSEPDNTLPALRPRRDKAAPIRRRPKRTLPESTDLRGPSALGLSDTAFSTMPVDSLVARLGPLERPIAPADYTGTYVLLASAANSSSTTGSVHNCDGGWVARGRKADAALFEELLSGASGPGDGAG